MVEREIAENERRKREIDQAEDNRGPSVVQVTEDVVSSAAHALTNSKQDGRDIEREREANDEAQRS